VVYVLSSLANPNKKSFNIVLLTGQIHIIEEPSKITIDGLLNELFHSSKKENIEAIKCSRTVTAKRLDRL
jgi:hypothetical protein